LGDVREKIVGNAIGIFTDPAAFVSAHRVEVAEESNPPSGIGA
jgi:hypothetical protein